MAINLYSFVENPFTNKATLDWSKLADVSRLAQRVMDNIIDLEAEHIDDITNKIKSDPESDEIKAVELNLWNKIKDKTLQGRRTGIGITAEGDMLAALGIQYGSDESIEFCEKVHKCIATNCYESSIELAKERGAFGVWNQSEIVFNDIYKNSDFIKRIHRSVSEDAITNWMNTGRRNIACLTVAPTGTVSLMTQTTSGIEPLFKAWYVRRRKTSDKSKSVFVDKTGDMFEEFKVFHPKFITWLKTQINNRDSNSYCKYQLIESKLVEVKNGKVNNLDLLTTLNLLTETELQQIYEKSPWYNATAQDIDWVQKVKLQGAVQKWVDHSISCTTNLPKGTTEDMVNKVYLTAYDAGCKGETVYVDGSRDGVLITEESKPKTVTTTGKSLPIRPDVLPAKIVRFKNGSENWLAFIGMYEGNPYEIFTGKVDEDLRILPKSITEGKIIRVATGPEDENGKIPHRYDFQYDVPYGYTNTMPGISYVFDTATWNYSRLISGMLRTGVPVDQVINVLNGLNSDMGDNINTWKRGVIRAFKQFVKDGVQSAEKCSKCGAPLVYEGGCKVCKSCGWSKCD